MDRQTAFDYIKKKYKVLPEYPWKRYGGNAVFRHTDNKKWFALAAGVQGDKVGLTGTDYVDVINLKIDPATGDELRSIPGIFPAYHMNRKHWITVVLDDTLSDEEVARLIETSFELTS